MKFILNEKYILSEKYILTEATDFEKATSWQKYIRDNYDNFISQLIVLSQKVKIDKNTADLKTKYDNQQKALDELNTAKDKFKDSYSPELPAAYRGSIVNTFKNYLAALDKLLNAVSSDILPSEKKEVEDAKRVFENSLNGRNLKKVDNALKKIEDVLTKNVTGKINANGDKVSKNLSPVENTTKLIKEIVDTKQKTLAGLNIDISKLNETVDKSKTFIKNYSDNLMLLGNNIRQVIETNYAKSASFSNVINKVSDILTKINAEVKAVNDSTETYDALLKYSETGSDASQWKARLDAAADDASKRKEIIEEYFRVEWKENAEKVKSLGEAFVQEIKRLGFSETTNPFISLLKYLFGKNINVDSDHYNVIHNAYVSRYLNASDLKRTGVFKDNNIIFCADLYNIDIVNEKKLLELQYRLAEKVDNNGQVTNFKDKVYEDKFSNNLIGLLCAIFYEGGSINTETWGNVDSKLKNTDAANENFSKCFTNDGSFEKEKIPFDIEKINFANSEDYAQAILYIRDHFTKNKTDDSIITNIINKYDSLKNKNFDHRWLEKIRLALANVNIKSDNLAKVINQLIDKGKLK